MADALALYFKLIWQSVRAQLQYRASFVALSLSIFVSSAAEFAGLYFAFERFPSLGGWSLSEVAVLYGIVYVSLSWADATCFGFDQFGAAVRRGDFDRVLLRPRSTVLQLFGQELTLRRTARLLLGALVLGWGLSAEGVSLGGRELLLLTGAIGAGFCVFAGLWILQATLAFWTVQTQELMNVLTYGGAEASSHPVHIYEAWMRRLFIGFVPLACVSYFPALALLQRPDPLGFPAWFPYLAPALGPLFLSAAIGIWRIGVRHYTSTGS